MNRSLLTPHRSPALLLALLLAATPARAQIADTPELSDLFGAETASGDFDGDGFTDLAIGVPLEDIGSVVDAGAVHVIYGTAGGLNDGDDQFWHQDSPGLGDAAGTGDRFGSALAAGDLNGDGFDDLAVGSPFESRGAMPEVGQVHVLYGSAAGLTGAGSFYLPSIPSAQPYYYVGWALAAGDFDGDGWDDLAVGAPGRDFGPAEDAGLVAVLPGSASGVSAGNYRIWHQNTPGVAGEVAANDYFGLPLAAGDFNDDGRDDLAVGVYHDDVEGAENAGAAHVFYGTAAGLTAVGDQLWSQGTAGIEGDPEPFDGFGTALTVGDFDGDGRDDLAVGVPFEEVGSLRNAGAVNVIYGAAAGLAVADDQIWYQDVGTVADASEDDDYFAETLAAGDFDGDGVDDLAIGVPTESLNGLSFTGAVNVLYGTAAGLDDDGNQFWWQGSPDVTGDPEAGDRFGSALAAGDFDGDDAADLAVGVMRESVGATAEAGAANVLYGGVAGLSAALNQILHQGLNLRIVGPGTDADGAVLSTGTNDAATAEAPEASVGSVGSVGEATGLLPAAPNPFAARTTVGFELAEAGPARLAVYDLLGREVAVLIEGTVEAGRHEAVLDGSTLPSGAYIIRLTAGAATQTQRVSLVR
jgi:hypothetical protein